MTDHQSRILPTNSIGQQKLAFGTINLSVALSGMAQDRSKFNGIVKTMTRVCQMEETDKNLTVMNKKPR